MADESVSADAVTHNTIGGGTQLGPVLQAQKIDATFQMAAAVPVALDQLPPRVAGFTGRDDELHTLTALLDPASATGAVVVSAVAGLAGVGKTALAVTAGHVARERRWYQGGVLFIDLHGYDEGRVEPREALDVLLRALGVPAEHIPPGTEERAGLYRSALAEISESVLVIADNASSEAQVRLLLPGVGAHRTLVTSRHTLAGLDARLLDVTVLDDRSSVQLLDTALRAARPGDDRVSSNDQNARRLAKICGGLPLALQIVAALLKADPTCTVSEMAKDLTGEQERLKRLRYDDGGGKSMQSVEAAFDLSYRRLDSASARLFRLLPLHPGPDMSATTGAVLAELPVRQARMLLAGLAKAHLIEPAPGIAGRWRMHDLLRLYAQRLCYRDGDADGREQAQNGLFGHYMYVAFAAVQHFQRLPDTSAPKIFKDRTSALAWLDTERRSLIAAVTMAADTGKNEIAVLLSTILVRYFEWQQRFDDQLATGTVSLEAARRLSDRIYEAQALTIVGNALIEMRRFEEAITAHQDMTAISRETGNPYIEGMALNNLGNALSGVRRFEEAITAHQDAAAIFRQHGDRHNEGGALNNLGSVLTEMLRFEEAITAHKDAAAIYRETADRYGEANALSNLGRALTEVERSQEAITACRDAAAIFEEVGDQPGRGVALHNLGRAFAGVGQFEDALTAYHDAAAIYQDIGDRHSEGKVLNDLGRTLTDAERFEEAVTAHQDAAAVFQETSDRHRVGMALNDLGNALLGVRRSEEAVTAYQDAAVIHQETADQHGKGVVLNNLGNALIEVQRFEEAVTVCRDAAAIFRQHGDRHGEGQALKNLSTALIGIGRFEEALTVHQDAMATYEETGDLSVLWLSLPPGLEA